jgi:hypothetical protein
MEATHDEGCPGCIMARRRALNGIGARISDYKTHCTNCGVEIVGEFEHRVNWRDYCQECIPKELSPATH